MSKDHLKIRKGLLLTPQTTEPANPVEGDMYFDAVVGLRLRKNGVWQTAGGQGEVKVELVDRISTTLPATTATLVDGETILDGDKVLFTNLTIDNNRVYKATVVATNITWSAQPDFAGQFDPSEADVARVIRGSSYCLSQFIFKGTDWIWGQVDFCAGEATLGSPTETWGTAYIDDLIGESILITTNATAGDAVIAGTEKLSVTADGGAEVTGVGGLDVSGGLTQTKSITEFAAPTTDISQNVSSGSLLSAVTNDWMGQSFTPTISGDLKIFRIHGHDDGTTLSGSFVVDIYAADGGGEPTGPILTTSDVFPAGSFVDNVFNAVTFSGGYILSAGTQYVAVINRAALTGSIRWNAQLGGSVYAGGGYLFSSNGGASWSTSSDDFRFEVDIAEVTYNANIRLNAATSGYLDLTVPDTVTDYQLTFPAAQGTSGQLLTNDGSGNLTWEDPILGFNAWTVINSNTIATAFDDFGVDTTSNTVDITLPATPANGSRVRVIDREGSFSLNSCFIKTTDGSTIETIPQPLEIDISYIWAEFVYDSAANNWAIYGPLAKGDAATLQDAYDGDAINNPVQITTNVTQGDLSITGTEKFRVSTSNGMKVSSNTPSGIVLEVDNTGTDQNTTITSSNVANTNPALELKHANSSSSTLRMHGATSGDVDIRVPAAITSYDWILPATQGGAGTFLTNDGSGNLSWDSIDDNITLQEAYVAGNTITTDGANGDTIIAGTEKMSITATGGLDVSGGTTQTKATAITGTPTQDLDTNPGSVSFAQTSMGTDIWGQQFTPSTTGNITEIRWEMLAIPGATGGGFKIDIYTLDISGHPDTLLGSSDTVDYTLLTSTGNISFPFTSPVAVSSGTMYGAVFVSTIVGTTPNIRYTSSDSYLSHDRLVSSDGGSSWTVVGGGDFDMQVDIATETKYAPIRINAKTSGYLDLTVPDTFTNWTWTLPPNDGDAGQFLQTDGTGVTTWATAVTDISGKADTDLGNLTSTAINANLVPDTNGSRNLGDTSNRWNNVYAESFNNPTAGIGMIFSTAINGTGNTGGMTFSSGNASGASNDSGNLLFETGDSAASNSGDISFEIGTAIGGTRGSIYLKDGSEGTPGHVWTHGSNPGEGSWAAIPAVTMQNAYDNGRTITLAGGNTPIDITGPAGQTGDAINVTNNGTATSANGIRSTATNGVAFRGTSGSYGIYIDATGSDPSAYFTHSGTGFAAVIEKTTSGSGLDINVVGGGQGLDVRNTGVNGVGAYIYQSNATNPSAAIITEHNNPAAAHWILRNAAGISTSIKPAASVSTYTITLPENGGITGTVLHNDDGAGTTSWKRTGWVTKTVNNSPQAPIDYDEIYADTNAIAITFNMPAAAKGLRVRLIDDQGTWATNNVTVNGNGADTFDGVAGPLTLNINNRIVELIGDTNNWRVVVLK